MNRLTEKDKKGKYYIVEEKICMGTLQINPIRTWIVGNENRGYGKPIDKLAKLEDLMEKYNVNEEDIERALIVKKIIQNDSVYYEDDNRGETYYFGMELSFDFETNEIVLSEEYDDEYWSKWEEIARLPILDYKKKYWLKEDKSE